MEYWGIEDEIAGHFKRYTFDCFDQIAKQHSLKLKHIAGLTFPLSNILFPLSNYLVSKHESKKLSLSKQEQTVLSGNRKRENENKFPCFFGIFLNK